MIDEFDIILDDSSVEDVPSDSVSMDAFEDCDSICDEIDDTDFEATEEFEDKDLDFSLDDLSEAVIDTEDVSSDDCADIDETLLESDVEVDDEIDTELDFDDLAEESDSDVFDDFPSEDDISECLDEDTTDPFIEDGENLSDDVSADDSLPQDYNETEELSDDEKAEIIKDFADQNVSPFVLPATNGHWEGEPGDSAWIPDDDVEFSWQKGGETHTTTYGELKSNYGIDGIEYFNKEPDFSDFEDALIQHAELEAFSEKRTGKDGTYSLASQAVAERLSQETGEEWTKDRVQEYMKENGLTWHECADRKTVRAIPTEINAAFKHTGGIGLEKSISAAAESLYDRFGQGGDLSLALTPDNDTKYVDMGEVSDSIKNSKQAFREKKRNR